MFAPGNQIIITGGRPLFGMVQRRFPASDAGVKDHRLTLAIDRAATGPDFRFTGFTGRPERDGQMLPFRQITTANVSPVFRAAAIAERMQLIEEMIKTFVKNRAIRIVDPLGRSRDVKNRPGGISLGARRRSLDGRSRTGKQFVRGFSTRAERQEEANERGELESPEHRTEVSRLRPHSLEHNARPK